MNRITFCNPFEKASETTLLISGIVALLAGSAIGMFFQITYDSYFSIHLKEMNLVASLSENLLNIIVMSIPLIIFGKILNRQTRIIDIINTSAIARIPLYTAATFTNNESVNSITSKIVENINTPENLQLPLPDIIILITFSGLVILFLILSVVILFLGFKTAVNAKKITHYLLFLLAIILGEFLILVIHFLI